MKSLEGRRAPLLHLGRASFEARPTVLRTADLAPQDDGSGTV
jgi:hypothetical protein